MTIRVSPVASLLVLAMSGCLADEKKVTTVSPSPWGTPAKVQPAKVMHAPATEAVSLRVATLGRKIVADNPQINRNVTFFTLGAPQPELFHRVQSDNSQVYITEGLVKQCKNDGELAALLCQELGKMAAEQAALARPVQRRQITDPMPHVPVGNDIGGAFGAADGTHLIELARVDKERRQAQQASPTPPPPPENLARIYLQNAGFDAKNLDAVAPLLRNADQHDALEKQMTAPPGRLR